MNNIVQNNYLNNVLELKKNIQNNCNQGLFKSSKFIKGILHN